MRLAQSGLAVTVLEASQLGIGASTRNQGWLHSGAWYAPEHVELARMCYGSLQRTLRFCPECVEPDPAPMVYLASRGETDSGERISARLVILAGNAKGGSLFPGFGADAVGENADKALMVLKTHLLAA